VTPNYRCRFPPDLAEQAATDLSAAAMPEIDTSITAGYDAKLDRYRAAPAPATTPAPSRVGVPKLRPNATEPSTS
jgi:hypothetical protein